MNNNSPIDKAYERSSESYEKGIEFWKIPAAMTVVVLLIITIFITAFSLNKEEAQSPTVEPMMEYSPADAQKPIDLESYSFKIEEEAGIESRAALVMNRSTGNTICYKNPDAELPPASLTKAMTVLVALENVDPNMTVRVTGNSAEYLASQNASVADLKPGQTVTILDLCYAAMLPSGGDAAMELAEHVSGSEQAFVQLMNKKAEELGMTGTTFRNVTGLDHPEHISTAEDLMIMLKYALQNPDFYDVFTTDSYTIPADSIYPEGLTVKSTVFKKQASLTKNKFKDGATLLGGKSGYTPNARLCLATLVDVNGTEYITVTLGAGDANYNPYEYAMIDTIKLINSYVG